MHNRSCTIFLVIAAFLTLPSLLPAASVGITGKIVEPDGKPSPSAAITVVERNSGVSRVSTADEDGAYSAPDLAPGLYNVSAKSAWTGATANGTVELSSGGSVELSLRLSGEWNIFDVRDPASAPFTAGNYLDLLRNGSEITRGEEGGNIEGYGPYSTRGNLSFNSIGMRGQDNNFLLDGMDNNDAWLRGPVIASPIDAIESVRLDAVYIPANEGHAAGGVVDVVTRTGSSSWHGTGFDFLGNSALNTRNYFDGATKPGVTRNQFGGSVGGPVCSKCALGKGWFFYLSADALRARDGLTIISTVPTADEKAGNFGAEAIYNPLTLAESGPNTFTSQPFQFNRIPASVIPLQAQNLIHLYPDPNLPGLANNFRWTPPSIANSQRYAFLTDKTFTPRDTLFVRVNYERNNTLSPSALPGDAGSDPTQHADDANVRVVASGAAVGQTFAVSPALINEIRLGFSRLDWNGVPLDQSVNPAVTLGIPGLTPGGLPVVSPEGYAQLGATQGVPGHMRSTSYELRDSVRWTTARHHFVFGTQIIRRHLDGDTTDWTSRGTFLFTPDYTDLPAIPNTGNSIASLLTGYPAEVRRDVQLQPYRLRGWEMAGFAEDTFRILRRLTVTVGVRYSHDPPVTEADNRMVNFNFSRTDAALDQFAGKGGVNKYGGLNYKKLSFAPRLGLALDLSGDGSTVLRGAFSQDFEPGAYIAEGFLARNAPYASNLDMFNGSLNVGPTLAGGLPAPSFAPLTGPASIIAAQTSINTIEPVGYTPYADQWGLFLEHRLKRGLTVEIAGMGSMGIHLYETYNINPAYPLPIPTNPQRYPYSVYDTRVQYLGFAGGSTYYGGQAKLAGQIARGLQLLATYRYAKSIDDGTEPETFQQSRPPEPQNTYKLHGNRSPSPFDVPQRLVANVSYDLPLRDSGRGGVLETIFGNWRLAGAVTVQSGFPFTPWLATNDLDNAGYQLPNRVGSGVLPGNVRSPMQWFNTSLNPATPGTAFLIPPMFQFGDSGFDILRGPRLATVDTALSRTFPVRERFHIQTRIEGYNLFNRANFALPNPILGLDSSGVISHTITPSRSVRLVARLDW